jgi:uncharacterized protein (DUF1499 family)
MLKEQGDEKTGSGTSGFVLLSAVLGIILAVVAVFLAVGSGLGSSINWWSFRTGFTILRWSAYLAVAAGLVSAAGGVVALFRGGRIALFLSIAGFLLSLAVVGSAGSWWATAKRVPVIHDISTDTENPPSFVVIPSIRQNAQNSLEYGGPEVARLQHIFYPDIGPLLLAVPMDKAFEDALTASRLMGWQIVAADEKQGRIEAVATTRWFHFKDDIVVRLSENDGQSRIDVRSVSRVGKSDIGTNARRIRAYLKILKENR